MKPSDFLACDQICKDDCPGTLIANGEKPELICNECSRVFWIDYNYVDRKPIKRTEPNK